MRALTNSYTQPARHTSAEFQTGLLSINKTHHETMQRCKPSLKNRLGFKEPHAQLASFQQAAFHILLWEYIHINTKKFKIQKNPTKGTLKNLGASFFYLQLSYCQSNGKGMSNSLNSCVLILMPSLFGYEEFFLTELKVYRKHTERPRARIKVQGRS